MRIVVVLACIAACGKSSPPASVASDERVHVDRRVETIAILERLAGSDEYRMASGAYIADVDKQFAAFGDHRAVAITRELRRKGLGFEQPMQLAIRLDDTFQLATGAAAELCGEPASEQRWCGVDVAGYAAQIRAFAAAANVDAFFTAHADYYATIEQRFRDALAREHPAAWLTGLFGPSAGGTGAKFTVVPAPLQGPHNYGVHRGDDLYQLMSVDDIDVPLIVHEMAHSFVNPLVDKHYGDLASLAQPLFALVQPAMQRQHYTTVRVMLYESLVRAVTSSYARDKHGDRAAADAIRGEVRRGFPWTAQLADTIDKFRAAKVPIETYWPKVVETFRALDKQFEHGLPPTPYLGPIDAAVLGTPLVIVRAPDVAADMLEPVRAKLGAAIDVASQRGLEDHPASNVMAFGTAASNPVVAEIARRAGWSLDVSGLVLGTKKFVGANVVLIATWPREDDPSRGVVVYTAAATADIAGILALHAGDTDWVVGQWSPDHRELKVLGAGDFRHAADGAWLPP